MWQKLQHSYNLVRNDFSPNLKGLAQKIGTLRPLEVLDTFGGKSKFEPPKAFKFGTKWVPIEVNIWWKFGVDISKHFWEIQNLTFFHSNSFTLAYKNNFQKLFLYLVGGTLKEKIFQIWISQSWLKISTPNFHQLLTYIGTRFVQNLKTLGALDLNFPPKASKTSNGCGRPIS